MGDSPIAGWFLLGKILTWMRTGDSPIYGNPHLLFYYIHTYIYITMMWVRISVMKRQDFSPEHSHGKMTDSTGHPQVDSNED
jgi:hypothetical protein